MQHRKFDCIAATIDAVLMIIEKVNVPFCVQATIRLLMV